MADNVGKKAEVMQGERAYRSPGPDYPIRIETHAGRVVVHAEDQVLADSESALILYESSQPPAVYFPRADVDTALLVRSDMVTFSPYKGDCSYYMLDDGESGTSIAWSYESAPDSVSAIRGYLAFVPDRVDIIGLKAFDVTPAEAAPATPVKTPEASPGD